jgi:hypothetical protein
MTIAIATAEKIKQRMKITPDVNEMRTGPRAIAQAS